jgi:GntR family transcriptional regulator/MocR family aminotransferase
MAPGMRRELVLDKEPVSDRFEVPIMPSDGPLHARLYRRLRTAILRGELTAGTRLPSTRALAADEGVSRNTVLRAYDQLLGEGYATARQGSGTTVTHALPGTVAPRAVADQRTRCAARPPRLSRYARRLPARIPSWRATAPALPYDFRYGRPSFADFPHALWRRLLARNVRRTTAGDLDYGEPAGLPALRAAIASYLVRARSLDCRPEQIVVVHGSQQGIDLVARVLVDPGDPVVVEEPHYSGTRAVLAAAGARLIPVPVDGQGMDVARAERAAASARLACVTPSHQFPTGSVMTLPRRLALLSWAERTGAFVLEDDYDSEFRYAGQPIESLHGLDRTGRVIYVGTFSKVLFPALRLGYLVLPEALVDRVVAAKAVCDTGSAGLEQRVLADFMTEGHFARHLRRTRARHRARRAALVAAVREHLAGRVEMPDTVAGLHVLVWLKNVSVNGVDALIHRAAALGVGVYSPASFYAGALPRAGLLLGHASLDESAIREGIRRLARALPRGRARAR